MTELAAACLPGDADRLFAAAGDRRGHIARVLDLLGKVAAQQAVTSGAQAAQRQQEERVRALTGQAEQAESGRDRALQALADELDGWAVGLSGSLAVPAELRETWLTALVELAAAGQQARPVLAAQVGGSLLTPARSAAVAGGARAATDKERAEADWQRLQRLIDDEQRVGDPTPADPVLYGRRARPAPGIGGAPLWRLLDPHGDLPAERLDALEAALAAAGLLEVWVSPDGTYRSERDGADVVLAAPAAAPTLSSPDATAGRLSQVLTVAHDAGRLAGPVRSLLHHVRLLPVGQQLPAGSFAVGTDGRFTTPATSGQALPPAGGASLIGSAARAAARQRRIDALTEQRHAAEQAARDAQTRIEQAGRDQQAVTAAEQALPSDDDVVQHTRDAARLAGELDRAAAELDRRTTRAAEAAAELDRRQATASAAAAEHALPAMESELTRLREALGELRHRGSTVRDRQRAVARAEAEVPAALAQLRERQDDALRRAQEAEQLAGRQRELAAERSALHQRLTSSEADVLARMDELTAAVRRLDGQAEQTGGRLAELLEAQLTAKVKLAQVEQEREAADGRRASAHARWLLLAGTGLPAARGVPMTGRDNLRASLEEVRAARDRIALANWPRDPEAQDGRVQAAYNVMTGAQLAELRATLEATAGRTARLVPEDDPTLPDRVEIVVDGAGRGFPPSQAVAELDALHTGLSATYDERLNEALHELLGSAFMEHMHERLGRVNTLIAGINAVLEQHPTGTSRTTLRLVRVPVTGWPRPTVCCARSKSTCRCCPSSRKRSAASCRPR